MWLKDPSRKSWAISYCKLLVWGPLKFVKTPLHSNKAWSFHRCGTKMLSLYFVLPFLRHLTSLSSVPLQLDMPFHLFFPFLASVASALLFWSGNPANYRTGNCHHINDRHTFFVHLPSFILHLCYLVGESDFHPSAAALPDMDAPPRQWQLHFMTSCEVGGGLPPHCSMNLPPVLSLIYLYHFYWTSTTCQALR